MKNSEMVRLEIAPWSVEKVEAFQDDFLSWYDREKRTLPWRENSQPYRVWVSEIMLQQTRVETVIPYFYRFMEWFPTIEALANAPEEQLLKAWEGLGYYSRVRNLQKAAQEIVQDHGGRMPHDISEIAKLKGIGPYTAGAIASIAFNQAEPAIDGNVMRVFSRLFSLSVDIAKPASRKIFDEVVRMTISHDFPSEFNQAIMDLGSRICTPTSPKCEECPLQKYCDAYANQTQSQFPVKSKKVKPKPIYYLTAAIQNDQGQYLLEQRPSSGLLANMWCFPLIEVSFEEYNSVKKKWQEYQKNIPETRQLSLVAENEKDYLLAEQSDEDLTTLLHRNHTAQEVVWQKQPIGEVTHIFSHLKWHLLLSYGFRLTNQQAPLADNQLWVTQDKFAEYVLPKHQHKLNELLTAE